MTVAFQIYRAPWLKICFILCCVTLFFSCEKEVNKPNDTSKDATLILRHYFQQLPISYSQSYTFPGGRSILFSGIAYYLSNFRWITDQGDTLKIQRLPELVNVNKPLNIHLGKVPPENLKALLFDTGLHPDWNVPNIYPENLSSDHPMHPNASNYPLYWDRDLGYVSMYISGLVDTAFFPSGQLHENHFYRMGTNQVVRTVKLSFDIKNVPNAHLVIHAKSQVDAWYQNIVIPQHFVTDRNQDPVLTGSFADGWSRSYALMNL